MIRFMIGIAMTAACAAGAQQPAAVDSLHVAELAAAESTVDSLRAELRRLDRDLQAMKQDYADGGDVDRLLSALAGSDESEAGEPRDTRSRRRRVDALLNAITQRPGQLRFNGGATMVVQDLAGGEADGTAGTNSLDLYAHTSFGPSTLLFFAFEAGGGDGLDGFLPLAVPINGDAVSTRSSDGFDQLVLNEAWAEFTALHEAVTVTVGKLDLTNYFDINAAANDETAQFVSGAFVNSAALLAPAPGAGLRARTVLLHRFSVQGAVISDDASGGTRFRDAFAIGSVGMNLFAESAHEGNLRAFLYAPAHVGGAQGWGLSVDQGIVPAVTAFGRYGRNDEGLLAEGGVERAWSAGLQWQRALRGRPFVLAAAYGQAQDADDALERSFEAYASWQVNTWTFISPHLQVARNEAAMARAATVLGLRVQFNF